VILPSCPLNFVQKMSLLMRAGKEVGMTSLPMLFQAAAKIEMPPRSALAISERRFAGSAANPKEIENTSICHSVIVMLNVCYCVRYDQQYSAN